MPFTKIEDSQFQFTSIGIRHNPTGAHFAIDPGQTMPKSVDWSRAGDTLSDGREFDQTEIRIAMEEIVKRRGPKPAH